MKRSEVAENKLHLLNNCCRKLVRTSDSINFVECEKCGAVYLEQELLNGGETQMDLGDYASSGLISSETVKNEQSKSGTWKLTIKDVKMEEIGDGEKPVVYFEETENRLALNKTNTKKLIENFDSSDSEKWEGEVIELKVVETTFRGKTTDAVRVA